MEILPQSAADSDLTQNRERPEPHRPAGRHTVEELSTVVVDAAHRLHRELGPGLLEAVYEILLARELRRRGLEVIRQKPVPVAFDGLQWDEGFRADLLVDGRLLVELKSVEQLTPVHPKQVLTYLRLMQLPLGLLINFGAAKFADGVKRVVNAHADCRASRLRLHPAPAASPTPSSAPA